MSPIVTAGWLAVGVVAAFAIGIVNGIVRGAVEGWRTRPSSGLRVENERVHQENLDLRNERDYYQALLERELRKSDA
jgi:hypothetical protein